MSTVYCKHLLTNMLVIQLFKKEVQGMIDDQRSLHKDDKFFIRIKTDQEQGNSVKFRQFFFKMQM